MRGFPPFAKRSAGSFCKFDPFRGALWKTKAQDSAGIFHQNVTPNATTPVRRLSGGNVQKVLVGREIASAPTVLMAAYPVRGLDINSSYLIYHLLNQQKEKGVAVIYVGEDLDVLLALCDRVIVLSGGRVTGTVDGRTATKEEIGLLMTKAEREGESHVKAE